MSQVRLGVLLVSFGVGIGTAVLMLATEPQMAIAWDEGYTLGREARIRDWLWALRDPDRFAVQWRPPGRAEEMVPGPRSTPPDRLSSRWNFLFDREVVEWFWPFAREEPHGHPPFYALVGLLGDILAPKWQDLPRARLGPILAFCVTAAAIFQFVALRWGLWPAVLAAGAWAFQPNLFAHGHYASYDGLLTSLWVLAIIAFAQAVSPNPGPTYGHGRWGWVLCFGLILGCAAATKLTGWFLSLPFLLWAGLYRSRQGFKTLFIGVLIATVVLYLLIPPWWTQPVEGPIRFLESNLTRAKTQPIGVQFLGNVYVTPTHSLPWYNTLLWTVLVTPVGFLAIAGVGLWSALRFWRSEPIGLLIAAHWAFLILLRALPHTPGHDGVRLFLPAFGVLALLAGLGARFLVERWLRWAKPAITLALLEAAISVAVMMPVPLSYFSPIVGGLPGAAALGMEPTYYWDALSPEARQWLRDHTRPGQTILFRTNPLSWLYLRKTGELPKQLAPIDGAGQKPQWVVFQNRPGEFFDEDRAIVATGHPQYTVTKLGVPLVWIFPYSAVREAAAQTPQ